MVRRKLILLLVFVLAFAFNAKAQFTKNTNTTSVPGQNASSTNINGNSTVEADTAHKFTLKGYARGLMHKDSLSIGHLVAGSAIFPGGAQIYNRQYWKLPIVYGGLGAGIYFGISNNVKYQATGDVKYKNYRTLSYAGAAFTYWLTLMDGVTNYKTESPDDPMKATFYSLLCPGLGQAYNGEYWKIPLYYSAFLGVGYYVNYMNIQYRRFQYIYKLAEDETGGYIGHITSKTALYYRDLYRRYRDYGYVAGVLVYAITAIDANVFAYMKDFEVNDDLTFNVEPATIPILSPQYSTFSGGMMRSYASATGIQMQFKF